MWAENDNKECFKSAEELEDLMRDDFVGQKLFAQINRADKENYTML